jgi:hypothetical protein
MTQRRTKTKPIKAGKRRPTNGSIPRLRVSKAASLREIYTAARRAFTASDLEKYAEVDDGIPAQTVLAELEAKDRTDARSRKRRS